MTQPKLTKTSLETDLLHFYDDFVEFHDNFSFLCDAFACLATEEDYLDTSTAMGVSRFSHWIKNRTQELKRDLKKIHEKAYTQNQTASKAHNQKLKRKRKKTRLA